MWQSIAAFKRQRRILERQHHDARSGCGNRSLRLRGSDPGTGPFIPLNQCGSSGHGGAANDRRATQLSGTGITKNAIPVSIGAITAELFAIPSSRL